MNETQYRSLNEKLDLIVKALFMNLVKGLNYRDQIIMLHNFGLKEIEIAMILGSSRDKVHGIIHYQKRREKNGI
jgi:hypothetical protein